MGDVARAWMLRQKLHRENFMGALDRGLSSGISLLGSEEKRRDGDKWECRKTEESSL